MAIQDPHAPGGALHDAPKPQPRAWPEEPAQGLGSHTLPVDAYDPEPMLNALPMMPYYQPRPGAKMRRREWKWPEMSAYVGFTHIERVRLWQFQAWLTDAGVMQRTKVCSVCQTYDIKCALHAEDYYDFRKAQPICPRCHKALHRRAYDPSWTNLVNRFARTGGEWFAMLPPTGFDLAAHQRGKHGPKVRDLFGSPLYDLPDDLPPTVLIGESVKIVNGARVHVRRPPATA